MKGSKIAIGALVLVVMAAVAAGIYVAVFKNPSPGTDASRAESMKRYRLGQLELGIAVDPVTPRVGRNRLVIELADSGGRPLTGVPITAYAEMAAMGAMPAMRAPAGMEEVAPGRYEGAVDLAMRGAWPLTVELKDPRTGETAQLKFDLATDRSGLELASGGAAVAEAAGGSPAPGSASRPASAEPPSSEAVITVDSHRQQLIGVETGEAAYRELVRPIRAVGEVTYDERRLSHVTLKFDGYIGDLKADYVGAPIEQGQVLFTVYSPDLLAAQREYLETLKRRGANAGNSGRDSVLDAARQRLRLWDIGDADIEALERRGEPLDYVPIHAPRAGTLIERNIADGSAAPKAQTLLTIADLSRVWIEAQVFEADFELVRAGMPARVTLPYLPGRRFDAVVDYVYPYLEGETRTGRVRLTLENAEGLLKPDMYAEVSLEADLGERLSVPEQAVIFAGESRVVFVDLGAGRLKPVRVRTGRRAEGLIEITDGLMAGDRVVTSGNFLIAAETRLKTGIEQW